MSPLSLIPLNFVLPPWAKWVAAGALVLSAYGLGMLQEARRGADAMVDYIAEQAAKSKVIVQAQVKTVTKTEIVYRDRIQKIYDEGKTIEARIPDYIKPADDQLFAVPVGFLRVIDAAWAGTVDGPAQDSDRRPSGLALSAVAAVEAGNATSCRAWRKQALGWREFYAGQQVAINGEAGAWFVKPEE